MTPEELDLLQEELEEYLPTSLQVKLGKLFDLVRKDDPIRKEWVENQRKLLNENKSWDLYPIKYPHTNNNINKLKDLLGFNPKKTNNKPDQNYGLTA